jgi:hypothetical protein
MKMKWSTKRVVMMMKTKEIIMDDEKLTVKMKK